MDFFKSILLDDPEPPVPEKPQRSESKDPSQNDKDDDGDEDQSPRSQEANSISSPNSSDGSGGGGWSFGGLVKTFATKSESVLETYRRDLKEFGSGLKKETEAFREAASRAVKELPASIEVGASAAHGSLETVGNAIDEVFKSTAEIISHGKDSLLAHSDAESDTPGAHNYSNRSFNSRRYSRFDAQLRAIQSDVNTYCEEPEDSDEYSKWKLGFVLDDKSEEFENLIEENGDMEEIYKRVVPNAVDRETFWCRYFFRVHKLKQQEDVRANLVKRAISADDEEELSWDVDDEDEEPNVSSKGNALENKELGGEDLPKVVKEDSSDNELPKVGSLRVVDEKGESKSNVVNLDESNPAEPSSDNVSSEKVHSEQTSEVKKDESVSKSDEKVGLDGKADHGESCKDSDVSVVSSQPSMPEEEDLGWDEIEDLGSNDEKKVSHGGSPNTADLRKRLSAADEDEDLNWDIDEDDVEPVKA
uniref:Putative BSD domain-containing protein 1-like n=1 Tax=Davidia involucrata TaxID=16924 RepID=A0A5B7CBE8_DAVIN